MSSSEMRALIDQYISAYNRMDVVGMLATVHPDMKFANISGGSVTASADGVEEFRTLAEQSKSLFSEREQTILDFEAGENKAVVSIAFHAVVANDLPNGLKKGQVLSVSGRSEFAFGVGKVLSITDVS